eukprot:CAMPEP_0206248476 /NCGR_PEP_ID=MMETSP0047_2-20121206/20392_1 /ASSEMBLY_ACC=CAM_ASM_000192 /TAXON_ID=195065 /ORGANISM="Chroomonas mesostigmatica_cf, Strain CCMP1168" /LENGTH=136 /DNA_ID=CAMNT_0053674127 /DNA_START=71 /DNA_END=478 /DNA_ORIENTATION=+
MAAQAAGRRASGGSPGEGGSPAGRRGGGGFKRSRQPDVEVVEEDEDGNRVVQWKKKESHSVIEQRRRARINEKMDELREILYTDLAEKVPEKAKILSDAVDYIRILAQQVGEAKAGVAHLTHVHTHLKAENERVRK